MVPLEFLSYSLRSSTQSWYVPWLSGVLTAVLHFSTTSSNLQNFLPSSSVWPRPTHTFLVVLKPMAYDVSKVEHVKLAFAIPVIDVTDLLANVSVNHFAVGGGCLSCPGNTTK